MLAVVLQQVLEEKPELLERDGSGVCGTPGCREVVLKIATIFWCQLI